MERDEAIKLLNGGEEGIEKWNAHREEEWEIPDLRGANLTDADLSGADLSRANLHEAKLSGANLHHADLSRACLGEAILIEAKLRGANLDSAFLTSADLTGADLIGADLGRADLHDADHTSADLTGADLIGADLSGANLARTMFNKANLSGLSNVELTHAVGYVLDDADVSTCIIPPGRPFRYSDPWSRLRRSYTGVMTAFHLLFGVSAFGPYIVRALWAPIGSSGAGLQRYQVALGVDSESPVWLVSTGVVIVVYNAFRLTATYWLSQLREEEIRSRRTPRKIQYWPWWLAHNWVFRWIMWFSIVLGSWRTWTWLTEPI